jgi:hypothetical protein
MPNWMSIVETLTVAVLLIAGTVVRHTVGRITGVHGCSLHGWLFSHVGLDGLS